jgi:hypothetical protein
MNFLRNMSIFFLCAGISLGIQTAASPLLAFRAASVARSALALAKNTYKNYRSLSTLNSSSRAASSSFIRTIPQTVRVNRTGLVVPRTTFARQAAPAMNPFQRMRTALKPWKRPLFFGAATAGTLGFTAGSYHKYVQYEQRLRDTAIAQVNGGVSGDDSVVSYNSLNVAMKVLKHVNPDKPVSFNVAKELHTLNKEDQFKAFDYILGQLLSNNDHSTMKELYDVISLLPAPHAEYPEFLAAVKANTGDCCRNAMKDALKDLIWRESIRLSGKPLLPKSIMDWVSKVGRGRIITAAVKGESLPETEIFYAKLPCSTSAKQYKLAAQAAAQAETQQS